MENYSNKFLYSMGKRDVVMLALRTLFREISGECRFPITKILCSVA